MKTFKAKGNMRLLGALGVPSKNFEIDLQAEDATDMREQTIGFFHKAGYENVQIKSVVEIQPTDQLTIAVREIQQKGQAYGKDRTLIMRVRFENKAHYGGWHLWIWFGKHDLHVFKARKWNTPSLTPVFDYGVSWCAKRFI